MERIIDALAELDDAQQALRDAVSEEFSVGQVIDYRKNGRIVTGEILELRLQHGRNTPELLVVNLLSDKEYSIDVTDVMRGDETLWQYAYKVTRKKA